MIDIKTYLDNAGKIVESKMLAKSMSRTILAHKSNVSPSTITNLINGQNIGFSNLLSVLNSINMTPADLHAEIGLRFGSDDEGDLNIHPELERQSDVTNVDPNSIEHPPEVEIA